MKDRCFKPQFSCWRFVYFFLFLLVLFIGLLLVCVCVFFWGKILDSPIGSILICSLVKHIGGRKVLWAWPVAMDCSTVCWIAVAAPNLIGLIDWGSDLMEEDVSGNGSMGVNSCCCFSGLIKELSTHFLLSIGVVSTLDTLLDESDESDVEPSDSLSLELSLFGDAFLSE